MDKQLKRQQSGFTLIELVMVIVILGILAATALPKFINLQTEAKVAATKGVAGSLGAGSAINYAAKLAGNANTVAVAKCADAASTTPDFPSGYTITPADAIAAGASATCTVTDDASHTATFTAYGVAAVAP